MSMPIYYCPEYQFSKVRRARLLTGEERARQAPTLAALADVLDAVEILIALFYDLFKGSWVESHETSSAMQSRRGHGIRCALNDKDAGCRRPPAIASERLE
jgi:hypothetical protein